MKTANSKNLIGKILFYAVMTVFFLFAALPFYVGLITSLTSSQELATSMEFIWWPKQGLDLSSYLTILFDDIFASTALPTLVLGFLNTLWIAAISVTGKLFFSGLAAYAYAKLDFKWKNQLFILQLATMMVPTVCMIMPSYMFYNMLGWTDGYLPIIIPGLFGNATMIFFFRSFFEGIPTSLLEAAKMDGVGTLGCYIRIMIPLATPAFMAQLIFSFLGVYNSYTRPLLYLTQDHQMTLQLALTQITTAYASYPNIKCAAAVIGLLPMVIIFLTCQKFFLEGLSEGGVKE